jgi:peptide/nickel transport system substrate-binding protein
MSAEITFGWPTAQLTRDPRLAYNSISKTYARMVFDSLLDVDPAGGELVPSLATSWRQIDALTVEFAIRPGVHFSDGTPLSGDAVRQSFLDILDLQHAQPRPAAVTMLAGLTDIRADDATVTFHFARHNAAFLRSLAGVNLAISKAANETRVGTGRWRPLDESGVPAALTDGSHRLTFIQTAHPDTDVYAGDPGTASGYRIAEHYNAGITYGLCPNASRGPLTDARIRRALSLLIDRSRLQPILATVGYTTATSVLAPTTLNHRDLSAELTYDPARARRLLDAAGTAPGLTVEVLFNSTFSPIDAELLRAVSGQWSEHGVRLILADVDFAELRSRQQSGDYDFRFFYYTGADPDVLRYQFAVSQRNMNRRTVSDDLDDLLDAQLGCADADVRRDMVHAIQGLIIERGLWYPIGNVRTVASYRPGTVTAAALDTEALIRLGLLQTT